MSFKAPKLSKSRSSGRLASSHREGAQTFKASFEDLRNPDGRTSLRNHFTGAFPEAQMRPSLESMNSWDAETRPGLSRSTSYTTTPGRGSTVASTPSTDSLTALASKRLSIVQEQSNAMDVAQAIKLLEEIKKTASAAELVALHKALLPSRSPQPSDDAMPGLIRRKSMLPPGVATRNASGDLLKTPEEAAAEGRMKRRPSAHHRAMTAPVPDQFRSDRPQTPDDLNVQMGAYGPGTLRITNGAASPAPSTLRDEKRKSVDHYETAPSTPVHNEFVHASTVMPHDDFHLDNTMAAKLESHQSRPTTRDGPRKLQKSDKSAPKRGRRASEPSKSRIPVPEPIAILSPRVYRPSGAEKRTKSREQSRNQSRDQSREASQSRTRSWLGRSRRSSSAKRSPHVDDSALEQLPTKDLRVSHTPLRVVVAHEVHSSEPSSANDEMVSPTTVDMLRPNMDVDLPRFAQRLSYRMSQLPMEVTSIAQLPSNPDDNTAALASLAQRLSNVSHRSSGTNDMLVTPGSENPEAALAKLNGEDRSQNTGKHGSADVAIIVQPATTMQGHRSVPDTADSGYGSEISNATMHSKGSGEAGRVNNPQATPESDHTITFSARKSLAGASGELSLCSFNQVLKSSPILSGPATPFEAPARGGKKHLSILGIHIARKGDATQTHTTSTNGHYPEVMSDSKEEQIPKLQKKKLQKAFPASVKKEMKAQKKQTEANRQANEPGNVPSVPENVRSSFTRHSQEMNAMSSLNRYRYFGTDPSDYVMNGPTEFNSNMEIPENSQPIASPMVAAMRHRSYTWNSQTSGSEATIVPRGHPRFKERFNHIRTANTNRSVDITPGPIEFGDKLLLAETETLDASKSYIGMEDSAAALLARRRSRDLQVAKVILAPAALSRTTSSVYDTNVPPMPQVTRNVEARVDGLAVKQPESESAAAKSVHVHGPVGYSTESVADAIKRAAECREPAGYSTESVAEAIRKMQRSDRKSKSKKKPTKTQALEESGLEAPVLEKATEVQRTGPKQVDIPSSDITDIPEGWEEQSKAWRKRRQSVGETRSKCALEEQAHASMPAQRKRASTSSVHTIPRKPVPSTRNSAEPAISHKRSESAEKHAEAYRDLISDEINDRPNYEGVGWRDSAGTFATIPDDENDQEAGGRVDSAVSAQPSNRILPSTSYQPRPSTESEMIRQARDHSLAKLTGMATHSAKASFEMPRRQRKASFNSLIFGRYSGGSELGYEGLGNSAGMRSVGERRATGLGLNLMENEKSGLWGVDMSDVPVLPVRVS